MWMASLSFSSTHFISSGEDRELLWSVTLSEWQDVGAFICLAVSELHQHRAHFGLITCDTGGDWAKEGHLNLTWTSLTFNFNSLYWDICQTLGFARFFGHWYQRDTWNFSTHRPVSVGEYSDISLIKVPLLKFPKKERIHFWLVSSKWTVQFVYRLLSPWQSHIHAKMRLSPS